MNTKDLFYFEKMITPKIVIVLYWLSLVGVAFAGVSAIFNGDFIKGILTIVLGAIIVRIYCEFITVIFQLNKNVQIIAEAKNKTNVEAS